MARSRPPAETKPPEAPGAAAARTADQAQLSTDKRVSNNVSTLALERPQVGRVRGGRSHAATDDAARSLRNAAAQLTDTELMLRVQAGDDSAFSALVEKFRRPMVGFMFRMAGNQAVAEELAQEVFLRVYRSRASYAAEAKFSTWLYRIATNLGLNHLRDTRSERAGATFSLDEPDEESGQLPDVADARPGVEQDLLRAERMRAIRRHVEALPERQRLAVLMHKYQELDYREIAKALKMSEPAVKSLLFRAYEVLRVKLKEFL